MDARNLEGYEDEIKAIMSAMPPELRLAGLQPEQRLAGLPPEPLVLGLPDDILREFPEKVLALLSPEAVAAIRERLGRA